MSHHSTAWAAINVLPDPLHERTATRLWTCTASRISSCFSHGLAPSMPRANPTGSVCHAFRLSCVIGSSVAVFVRLSSSMGP